MMVKKRNGYHITDRQRIFISDIERALSKKCYAIDKPMASLWISENLPEYYKFLKDNKDYQITKRPTSKQIKLMQQIKRELRELGLNRHYPTLDRQKASNWITKNLELLNGKTEERREIENEIYRS